MAPLSVQCLIDTFSLDALNGDCVAAERTARSLVSAQPHAILPLFQLAQALLGRGAALEAVQTTLAQRWSAAPEEQRELLRLQDETLLDAHRGDFEAAVRHGQEWLARVASATDEEQHHTATQTLTSILAEVGDFDGVDRIAIDFSKRRDAWQRSGYFDYSIVPWSLRYRAHKIPRAEFVAHRDDWLEREAARPPLVAAQGMRWVMAFADATVTTDDAAEAIARLPSYLPMLDPLTRTPEYDTAIGLTFLQGGEVDRAIGYLRRAATSCWTLEQPVAQVVANLRLGQALERQGRVADACTAYDVVLARWGHAAGSTTARAARTRAKALHCPPPAAP